MIILAGVILFPLSAFCADGPEKVLTDPDYDLFSVDADELDKWYSHVVDIPDRSLKEALLNDLGLSSDSYITVFNMLYNLPTTLEYSHLDIKDLKGLEYAINLEKLYVGNNLITDPVQIEPIKNLYNLKVLDLSRNSLTVAPEFLFEMKGLTSLNLSDNKINKIEGFGKASNLEELYLENNEITELADVAPFEKLVTLSISSNKLTAFPEDAASLKSLTALAVANNNLTTLPDFSGFTNLTVINLENNNLSSFPTGLGKLTQMVQLDISENNITSVPSEIFSLPKLSALFMSFNELTSIPKELCDMPALSVLDVSMNRINKEENAEVISLLSEKIGAEAFMHEMQFEDMSVEVSVDVETKKPCLTFGGIACIEALEGTVKVDSISLSRKAFGSESGEVFIELTDEDVKNLEYVDYEAQSGKDYEYKITAHLSGTYLGSRTFEYDTTATADTTSLQTGFTFDLSPTNIILIIIASAALILIVVVIVSFVKKKRK